MAINGYGHSLNTQVLQHTFDKLNVPDSIGHDSQDKPDGLPLVQGSVNRSQDKDSRERGDAFSSFKTAGSTYKDGQYSLSR